MNILFLSGLFPHNKRTEIIENSKGVIQYAANSLQWSFVKGFDNFSKTNLISSPFIGSFPFFFKKIYLSSEKFEHISGADDISLSVINIPIVKHFFIYRKVKNEIKKRLKTKNEEIIIVIYSVHSPFLKAARDVKKQFPNIKICLIVPDLPEFMSDSTNFFYKVLKKLDSLIIKKCLNEVDSFVLLTDNMAEPLGVNQKQWVRIEGIFDSSHDNSIPIIKDKFKTILYTGTLAKRYGIKNLVQAFRLIKSNSYRLYIAGEGDFREDIEHISSIDKRIHYLGQIPHNEILILQKKATVLINPRTSEGTYTKYSFPSKTLEYLASGTPTILYRLAGIPEEYYQYCFIPFDEEIKSLQEIIIRVCEKPIEELDNFGARAKNFVLENKNPKSQIRKVYEMLSAIK